MYPDRDRSQDKHTIAQFNQIKRNLGIEKAKGILKSLTKERLNQTITK